MVCEDELLLHKECYEKYLKEREEIFGEMSEYEKKELKNELNMSPIKEKRKSEEFENLKMMGVENNRDIRGKTIKENPSNLMQKPKKKI